MPKKLMHALTAARCKAAQLAPDEEVKRLCDGASLYLTLTWDKAREGALKNWSHRYPMPGAKGRSREISLGSFPLVSLHEARRRNEEVHRQRWAGVDPIDSRHARKAAAAAERASRKTFASAAQEYLAKHEASWKSKKHAAQWRSTLATYAMPVLSKSDVASITTDDVLRIVAPIWTTKNETADRVRNRIELILDAAGRHEDNPAKWSVLQHHLPPKRNRVRTVKHLSALPWAEAPAFLRDLRLVDSPAARALELVTLTAVRTAEATGATWSEVDLAAKTWTISKERTKRDREHIVPLNGPAVALLSALPRTGERVFPSVGPDSMLTVMQKLRPGTTTHGLRSCFRSWAGACSDAPRDVCELCLGHSIGNTTEQSYARDALLVKRARLMQQWADHLAHEVATVTQLPNRAAVS